MSVESSNTWMRPRSILLNIKKRSVPDKNQPATLGGSINHGLDEVGTKENALPDGVVIREMDMVDSVIEDNNITGIHSLIF